MSSISERPRAEELQQALAGASSVELGEIDVEAACAAYRDAGYEVTEQLRGFLENYGELTVGWISRVNGKEQTLTVSVEEALDVFPPNVKSYSKQLGAPALPIGVAFDTDETVLLAANDDILFAGDAGMQRVANGFEEAVKALISGDWDRTFF
ncbi:MULTISPECIES: SUKH-3 domain-containing protein [Streptomyces]|uniref:SUKH-3 domain-containing protein n=1 Tax=Streptomyces TaxID=1883 RepID=UPI00131D60AE|nr:MULTISPECIES: SUKH-3 domain-containing protein [Streptomyces]GGU10433.1 hypothetical protein GCM10010272_64510 [Streptomyces lateritius]